MRRRAIGRIHIDRELALPARARFEHQNAPRQPTISIITSTYDRPNVLRLLIESIRSQTFTDWEMIIVGDRCSDDTEEVVRGFDESRIRYYNLDQNYGEQSGPNSIGVRLARGRKIAWINHDELLFSDHLENLLEVMTAEGAGLSLCSHYIVGPDPTAPSDTDEDVGPKQPFVGRIDRVSGVRRLLSYPASSWLVDLSLARRVGDWEAAAVIRAASSLHFLYRCWMTGAHIAYSPAPTLVAIQSGRFVNSYREQREREHVELAPHVIGHRSDEARFLWPITGTVPAPLARRSPRRLLSTPAIMALARVGWSPSEVLAIASLEQRGEFIERLRKRRGLD